MSHLCDAVLDCIQQVLIHLSRQCVIQQDVGALLVRAKGPNSPGRQHVPAVLVSEEVGDLLSGPIQVDVPLLNVLVQPLLSPHATVKPLDHITLQAACAGKIAMKRLSSHTR